MRRVCLPILLFAAYPGAAQPRSDDAQLHASLLRENLFRIAAGHQWLEPAATICLVTDPNRPIVGAAATLTNQMFVAIRVVLRWHEPQLCPARAAAPVFLTFAIHTPEAYFRGALGVALPLEGSHAWVFYDRAQRAARDDTGLTALLAHVMAHEIAHVLQGTTRHSENGILKAHWSDTDSARMAYFPLMFTREDGILIHKGLEERRARLVSNSSNGVPPDHANEISAPVKTPWPAP